MITAGVDEVGRGCLAGPVVSAAVILKDSINLKLLKDSKKITFKKRIEIAKHIRLNSTYAVGISSVKEILNLNILQAALLSMKRAIDKLIIKPELILIDGNFAPKGLKNFKTIKLIPFVINSINFTSIWSSKSFTYLHIVRWICEN